MRHAVVVFGYGCHLNAELIAYLNRVVNFIRDRQHTNEPVTDLFLCGGFTQRKSAEGKSEAKVMYDYLFEQLAGAMPWPRLEEDSYTTLDNAKNVAPQILKLDSAGKLTVFCEAQRALKVDFLIRKYWGRRANIETASWELMSPFKQFISTFYEILAVYFPPLAWFFRYRRIKRAEQI